MTTAPSDDEIEAMAEHLRSEYGAYKVPKLAADMLRALLAERRAWREAVPDGKALECNHTWEEKSYALGWNDCRDAFLNAAPLAQDGGK